MRYGRSATTGPAPKSRRRSLRNQSQDLRVGVLDRRHHLDPLRPGGDGPLSVGPLGRDCGRAIGAISAIWWMPYYPIWSLTYIVLGVIRDLRPRAPTAARRDDA